MNNWVEWIPDRATGFENIIDASGCMLATTSVDATRRGPTGICRKDAPKVPVSDPLARAWDGESSDANGVIRKHIMPIIKDVLVIHMVLSPG
jgi:hypothetical protein